jgi:hypothetical protein
MNKEYEKKNKYYGYEENDISDSDLIDSEDDKENEKKEYEYYLQTINIINKSLQNYVYEKSLPLCEYMTFEKIEKFINKNLR